MTTGNQKKAIYVGIFVSIGLIILAAGVLTLAGQKKQFVPSINVNAVFDDVGGLQEGNNIWFSGVKIGTVRKMTLHGQSQVLVVLHIEKKAVPFIHKDAKAKIGSDGLIGNRIIVLYDGSPNAAAIEDGDSLQVVKNLNTDEMLATLKKSNDNLFAITSDFKEISKKLAGGQGTIGALMTNDSLYRSLQATAFRLEATAKNSALLTSNLSDYAAQLQKPGSLTNDLIHDTVIMSNLKGSTTQLRNAVISADSFTRNLKTFSDQLGKTDNSVGVLLNDPVAAANLKTILQNLNSGSKKLDEDLEAIQHNFLFRGYFRKKAKREATGGK